MKRMSPGFTLMEIVAVVAIISTLAVLVGPSIMKYMGSAKKGTTQATLSSLKSAVIEYTNDMGHAPNKSEGGLNALIEKPKTAHAQKRWDGPYLDGVSELPADGWGNEFVYNAPPKVNTKTFRVFEILSYGENGEDGEGEPLIVGS